MTSDHLFLEHTSPKPSACVPKSKKQRYRSNSLENCSIPENQLQKSYKRTGKKSTSVKLHKKPSPHFHVSSDNWYGDVLKTSGSPLKREQAVESYKASKKSTENSKVVEEEGGGKGQKVKTKQPHYATTAIPNNSAVETEHIEGGEQSATNTDKQRQAATTTHYELESSKSKSCNDLSNSGVNYTTQFSDEDEEVVLQNTKKVSLHILKSGSQKRSKLLYKLKNLNHFSKSMDIMEGSKRIMKIKTKKHNFRKQQVKLFRDSEPLIAVLTWGVNQSVLELQNVPIPPIFMSSDFKAHWKIKKENHNFNKQNMPSHFKFKEYCPLVFKKLRQIFNYDDNRFTEIVKGASPTENIDGFLSDGEEEPTNNGTTILSDSELYPELPKLHYSQDRSLVIKFISSENVAEMHSFLPKYYRHIVEQGTNTLLPRYIAMYRLSTSNDEHGKGYYCILMENMFSRHLKIHRQYDLKGCTVGRQASQSEKQNGLLFDKDFIQAKEIINLEESGKNEFLQKLHSDVEFLSECKIISYSLLLGIHDRTRQDSTIRRVNSQGSPSDPNNSDKGYESPDNQILIPGDRVGDANIPPESVSSQNSQNLAENSQNNQNSNIQVTTSQISSSTINPVISGVRRLSTNDTSLCNYEFRSADGNQHIYYMGLIDCMSDYDAQKRIAHTIKQRRHGREAEISTVKPEKYKVRFLDFIKEQVLHNNESRVTVEQSAEL